MVERNYQICTKTIMDTSDPGIVFDENGISDYYHNFKNNILPSWDYSEKGLRKLTEIAEKIKKDSHGKKYDCIIGLSGGLDSSYVLYVAKEILGLRVLAFHVDAGWNTSQAVSNIEKLIDGMGIDLYTEVINWEEMKSLQLAFLKAQIPDQDLPQDCAFFSALYKFAKVQKIKYIITGSNISTECCREPEEWGGYLGLDKRLQRDIYSKYGDGKLTTFPSIDILYYKLYYRYVFGVKVIKPLDMVPYNKIEVENLLKEKFGWEKFQHKHHESRFTRFYEDFWLPRKFGFDKRRAHFSSLILTNQMTRDEALKRVAHSEMSEEFLLNEFEFVAIKLGITIEELWKIFYGTNKTYKNYKNKKNIIAFGARVMQFMGLEKRLLFR